LDRHLVWEQRAQIEGARAEPSSLPRGARPHAVARLPPSPHGGAPRRRRGATLPEHGPPARGNRSRGRAHGRRWAPCRLGREPNRGGADPRLRAPTDLGAREWRSSRVQGARPRRRELRAVVCWAPATPAARLRTSPARGARWRPRTVPGTPWTTTPAAS